MLVTEPCPPRHPAELGLVQGWGERWGPMLLPITPLAVQLRGRMGDLSHLCSHFPLYDLGFAVQRTQPLQDAL